MDTYFYREHAWAVRGEKVYAKVAGRKYERTSIVAGKCGKSVISALQYSGTMDSNLFEFWFKEILPKEVHKNSVIIMDNAAFHPKNELYKLAQNVNCELLFLPPYSPDLNPIEKFCAWLKRKLRQVLNFYNTLDDAISYIFKLGLLYISVFLN